MQGDGNLVIYGPNGDYVWDTATDGHPGSRLIVGGQGDVVIYGPDDVPVWAKNIMQGFFPTPPWSHAAGDEMRTRTFKSKRRLVSTNPREWEVTYPQGTVNATGENGSLWRAHFRAHISRDV